MGTTTGKHSQKEFVKNELKNNGFITRNKCLRNYISRLSAIIFVLRDEGFEFETKFVENKTAYGSTERDFVYYWVNSDVETTFFFTWFDSFSEENKTEIDALNFDEACSKFLSQTPIFLASISDEVHTKIGGRFLLSEKEQFKQFKIKK